MKASYSAWVRAFVRSRAAATTGLLDAQGGSTDGRLNKARCSQPGMASLYGRIDNSINSIDNININSIDNNTNNINCNINNNSNNSNISIDNNSNTIDSIDSINSAFL